MKAKRSVCITHYMHISCGKCRKKLLLMSLRYGCWWNQEKALGENQARGDK